MRTIDGDDDSYDKIDKGQIKVWYNDAGQIHRDGDLPAVIYTEGTLYYYKDGVRHRDGGLPAVIWYDGTLYYYKNGKRKCSLVSKITYLLDKYIKKLIG